MKQITTFRGATPAQKKLRRHISNTFAMVQNLDSDDDKPNPWQREFFVSTRTEWGRGQNLIAVIHNIAQRMKGHKEYAKNLKKSGLRCPLWIWTVPADRDSYSINEFEPTHPDAFFVGELDLNECGTWGRWNDISQIG